MRRPPAVARVLERVTATAREHEMFLPGQTVLVAVSGGPDSVCMLESLSGPRRLPQDPPDSPLRSRAPDDSAADAVYARAGGSTPSAVHLRVATSSPDKGASVELGCEQRHFAIAEVTHETGAAKIATGTHGHRPRPCSSASSRGADPRDERHAPVTGTQPAIDVTRDDVRRSADRCTCAANGSPNADLRFLRNAIRRVGSRA